jgi:hypothetical protein
MARSAEPLLLEGIKGMEARKVQMGPPYMYYIKIARGWTAEMYEAWGKPEKAAEWKQN